MDDDHHLVVDPTAVKQLQDDLYQRMQLMLPVAAAVMTADPPYKQGEPWSLVHSACLVSCPAMLHVALKWNPQRHAVRSKDLRAGGIRYTAPRMVTRLTYPLASLGKFNPPEASPVHDYPSSQKSVAPQMRKTCRCIAITRRDGIAPQP
jgi:hypothetical protein